MSVDVEGLVQCVSSVFCVVALWQRNVVEVESRGQEVEGRSQEVEGRSQEVEGRSQEVDG